MGSNHERVYALATRNRLLAASMFADIKDEQWRTQSLCTGWTVREVCAHLVPPANGINVLTLTRDFIRSRGNLDRMVDRNVRVAAHEPTAMLVAALRERAHLQLNAPVIGPYGPMVDTAIHLRDAARPLGLAVNPPPKDWEPVLDFLLTGPASRGFVRKGRTAGLRLVATDIDWCAGAGELVRGPAEAIAMSLTGRRAVYGELEGPGVEILRAHDPNPATEDIGPGGASAS